MDKRHGYLLLAVVFVLAGCTAPIAGSARSAEGLDPTVSPTVPLEETGLAGESRVADPWPNTDTVTVHVDAGAAPNQPFEPLVRETLRYWEQHDDRWGTYTTDWQIVDDTDADVTVALVDAVEQCGDHPNPGELIGCAPVSDPATPADGDERVRVVVGYDDDTTRFALKHEFGHLYGLSHDEEPTDVMTESIPTSPR